MGRGFNLNHECHFLFGQLVSIFQLLLFFLLTLNIANRNQATFLSVPRQTHI